MRIIKLAYQTGFKMDQIPSLPFHQLVNMVALEICQHPRDKSPINENRILAALQQLLRIKKEQEIRENIGTLIMDKVDHMMEPQDHFTVWGNLTPQQKNKITDDAYATLVRLMKQIVQESKL